MYIILCIREKSVIPILDGDENMATWDILDEAQEFAEENTLCQASEVMIVDYEDHKIHLR